MGFKSSGRMLLVLIVYGLLSDVALRGNSEEIISANLGWTISFTCKKQPTEVILDHVSANGNSLSKVVEAGQKSIGVSARYTLQKFANSFTIEIKDLRSEDEGVFRCYLKSENTSGADIFRIQLSIKPMPPEIHLPSTANKLDEGTTITLSCVSKGGKPEPRILWQKYLTETRETKELLGTAHSNINSNGTFVVRSEIHLVLTRELALGKVKVTCVAENGRFRQEKQLLLPKINLMPLKPVIVNRTEKLVWVENETLQLTCAAYQSYPMASVEWRKNGRIVPSTINEALRYDGYFDVFGLLTMTITGADHNVVLSCITYNSVTRDQGLSDLKTNMTLQVKFRPLLTADVKEIQEKEGANVTLHFKMKTNPPIIKVDWRKNALSEGEIWSVDNSNVKGPVVYTSRERRIIAKVSPDSIDLLIARAGVMDIGRYQISATNEVGTANSEFIALLLEHKPVCDSGQKIRYGAEINELITINCFVKARPNIVEFQWALPNGKIRNFEQGMTLGNGAAYASMIYVARSPADFGKLLCNASNIIGETESPCIINIDPAGPAEKPSTVRIVRIFSWKAIITCVPGFDGGYSMFIVVQEKIAENRYRNLLNKTIGVCFFEVSNLTPDTSYTIRACASNSKYWNNLACTNDFTFKTPKNESFMRAQNKEFIEKSKLILFISIGTGCAVVIFIVCTVMCCIVAHKNERKRIIESKRMSLKTFAEKRSVPEGMDNEDLVEELADNTLVVDLTTNGLKVGNSRRKSVEPSFIKQASYRRSRAGSVPSLLVQKKKSSQTKGLDIIKEDENMEKVEDNCYTLIAKSNGRNTIESNGTAIWLDYGEIADGNKFTIRRADNHEHWLDYEESADEKKITKRKTENPEHWLDYEESVDEKKFTTTRPENSKGRTSEDVLCGTQLKEVFVRPTIRTRRASELTECSNRQQYDLRKFSVARVEMMTDV